MWVIQQVAQYIERQRQTYRQSAAPLNANQVAVMQPFFPTFALDSARVVALSSERVGNAPFYGQLVKMGFEPATLPNFSLMAAITFVDTSGHPLGYF
jgi:hypothetical protein